ncbi:hypothetical protein [Thiothrix lacustris]|uniref:hypothetical protein n=1 Tax=Thiothrix lacustris TaxID=525917 RepID=UPI0006873266|nr:hypothetical protein [Thiothrix lacustris]
MQQHWIQRMVYWILLAMLASLLCISTARAANSIDSNGTPQTVAVGFYPMILHSLNQQNSTFYADLYVWMRWKGDPKRDPTATTEFVNNVEKWGFSNNSTYETPKKLLNGEYLKELHVQGQFFQPLLLDNYPLDKHELSIVLEDSTYPINELLYKEDIGQSGLDARVNLAGWKITGWTVTTEPHAYASKFGELSTTPPPAYSSIRYTVNIERPLNFFVWKLLLPLLIVLLLGCSALFIHPTYTEVRLAAPATALLSLVFLQQAYSASLPEVGYLVLLDKVYVLAYILVVGLMLSTIITSSWIRTGDEVQIKRTIQWDKLIVICMLLFFVVGTSVLLIS